MEREKDSFIIILVISKIHYLFKFTSFFYQKNIWCWIPIIFFIKLQVLSKYATAIETLATCSKVLVTDKPPASGCAILTISDKVSAHLNLKGLIDPEKEKDKLLKKKVVLESQVNKLNKLTKDTGKICLRFFCNFFSAFTDNYLLQQIF